MESRTLEVEGIHMRWLERGAGLPVVLVHGIPTSPALWRHVLPRVSGARLLAWEMVGYGRSIPEGRDRDLSVRRQAGYLRAWMRALGLDRAVFVGHDLGGGVLQIAAARDPSTCAGIVLTNCIGYDDWPIPAVKAMRAARPLVARLPDLALKASLAYLVHRGHDDRAMARESLEIHFSPYAVHGGARALARQVRPLDARDTRAVAPALPGLRGRPARVVWGAADRFLKIRYGERFARDLGCELVRIPGGKHFVPEDHPELVAAAIEDVVRQVERQALSPAPAAP